MEEEDSFIKDCLDWNLGYYIVKKLVERKGKFIKLNSLLESQELEL